MKSAGERAETPKSQFMRLGEKPPSIEPHHGDSDSACACAADAFAGGEIFVNMGVNNRVNFELRNRFTRNFEP